MTRTTMDNSSNLMKAYSVCDAGESGDSEDSTAQKDFDVDDTMAMVEDDANDTE